jgi:hypothetical protein
MPEKSGIRCDSGRFMRNAGLTNTSGLAALVTRLDLYQLQTGGLLYSLDSMPVRQPAAAADRMNYMGFQATLESLN